MDGVAAIDLCNCSCCMRRAQAMGGTTKRNVQYVQYCTQHSYILYSVGHFVYFSRPRHPSKQGSYHLFLLYFCLIQQMPLGDPHVGNEVQKRGIKQHKPDTA